MSEKKRGRPRKYALLDMAVGQYIDVKSVNEAKSAAVAAKRLGYDVITRQNRHDKTVRVWRVA